MTAARQQLSLLAMCVLLGVAVASPAAAIPVVVLLFLAVTAGILIARYGARQLSLACLVAAGFLAPMNNLRLGAAVTMADLFLVPCAVLAIMARSASPNSSSGEPRRPVRPDVLAALLLIAGGIIGSQFAVNLGASLSAIIRFGTAAVGVPLLFVAVGLTRRDVRVLAWAFLIGASLNAVVGVITYNPFTRGIGLSTHSNHLAAACMLATGFAAGLFLTSEGRAALAAAGLWGVCVLGILTSGSRAGALGEAILIVMLIFLTGSTRVLRWCLTAVIGVAVLLALNLIPFDEQNAIARVLGREPSAVSESNRERAVLRAKAIEGIEKHPLTGAGFEEARVAHNLYLQIWGAAGLIGLIGMGVLWHAGIRGLLEGMTGDPWVAAAAAAVISFLIVAVASNILWDRYLWFTLALFVTGRSVHPEPPALPDASQPAKRAHAGLRA